MTERDEPLIEGMKIDARNYMRHNPRVWHEALEEAIDKYLPPLIEAVRAEERERTIDEAQDSLVRQDVFTERSLRILDGIRGQK
jgi:CRISPR/Cas system CMR-associated protein Cmr5 small subunit